MGKLKLYVFVARLRLGGHTSKFLVQPVFAEDLAEASDEVDKIWGVDVAKLRYGAPPGSEVEVTCAEYRVRRGEPEILDIWIKTGGKWVRLFDKMREDFLRFLREAGLLKSEEKGGHEYV